MPAVVAAGGGIAGTTAVVAPGGVAGIAGVNAGGAGGAGGSAAGCVGAGAGATVAAGLATGRIREGRLEVVSEPPQAAIARAERVAKPTTDRVERMRIEPTDWEKYTGAQLHTCRPIILGGSGG